MAQNSERWRKILRGYRSYIQFEKRLSENTVESYLNDLGQFAHFVLHHWDVAPNKVEREMVERFMNWLYERGRESTSQARALSSVKSFFGFLVLEERMQSSPAELVEMPHCGRPLPDTLSTLEIDAMQRAVDEPTPLGRRNVAMLEVLYSCGLRVSELTSLRLGDLFFGEGYIRVVGKGNKQRLVPISSLARDRIQNYLDDRRQCKTSSDVLFLSKRNAPLTRVMVFTMIKQAAMRAGISKQISPHTFRHSFATHLLEGGASIRQVQELLGHESIRTTEIYTHLDTSHLRETMERLLPASGRSADEEEE